MADAVFSQLISVIESQLISAYRPYALKFPWEIPLQTESEGDDHADRARREEKLVKNIMKAAQLHLVVASLIMTVTFTAGFTLPGGFESDTNSPNKGTAILLRKAAFRAFVVSDAIAFSFSSAAVFAYFAMAANVLAARELTTIITNYNLAIMFQINAMAAVVVAFATGLYVTLEQSLGLAVTVCVISCSCFVVSVAMFFPEERPAQTTS